MTETVLDKFGRPIEEFDVLKVFHFVGPRRKRFYMYNVVIMKDGRPYGSHINSNPLTPGYPLWTTPGINDDFEIVQSKRWEKLDTKQHLPIRHVLKEKD